jgi:hypothetical protein
MKKRKKNPLRFVLCFFFSVLLFTACISEPDQRREGEAETEEDAGNEPVYQLTDHKTRAEGGAVPAWIEHYLEGNAAAVETLEEYQDRYVFIARSRGTNFRALEQWLRGFSVELDFARLAAMRIEKRLTQAASGFPDTAFGGYFEALIRAASDASWKGAVVEDSFWLKGFYQEAGENTDSAESYDFLVLVTVDKTLLASQIQSLLSGVKPRVPASGDQLAAFNRVRDRFFEGF